MSKTITKADIARILHGNAGVAKQDAARYIESTLEIIKEELIAGRQVKITGFGTFSVVSKKARKGRNPQTGGTVILPARKVIKFKESRLVKEKVNTIKS